jgi:formylglycine-generating enzyme required for sulfatase activity
MTPSTFLGLLRCRGFRALGIRAGTIAVFAAVLGAAQAAPPPDGAPVAGKNYTLADPKLDLLWVGAGTFLMGSPPDEPGRDRAEGPQTRVTLSRGFWLGRTEVTQAQYLALAGVNPSRFTTAGPDAPVEHVSWITAMEFCARLTARERAAGRLPEGYAYTLPTEAQWEYAYRAGTTASTPGVLAPMSWYDENSSETTHPVAQRAPNIWGFFDMSGNVLEWCYDWYGSYPGGSVTDPTGPASGYFRMARGGSWRTGLELGRSAARAGGSEAREDYTLGFRLALAPVR